MGGGGLKKSNCYIIIVCDVFGFCVIGCCMNFWLIVNVIEVGEFLEVMLICLGWYFKMYLLFIFDGVGYEI